MFVLKEPNAEAETLIFLLHTFSDGRAKFSLKKKVLPSCFVNQRCTGKYKSLNPLLDRVAYFLQSNPTRAEVAEFLTEPGKVVFFTYVQDLIDRRESGKELTNNKIFAAETIKGYRHTMDNLLKFEAETGTRLRFEMSEAVIKNVINFFQGKNHSINAIGKTVKNLKVFLKQGYKDGQTKSRVFESIKIPAEDTPDIYLNPDELNQIAAVTIPEYMEPARRWFLIEAFTGLRVSDVSRIRPEHIQNNRLSLSNEKTDAKVVLPIHPVIRDYLNELPDVMSDQKINKYIKEIAKLAGINSTVLFTITKGGKRVDEYLPKYEMVSNHTGRRSFITNLIRAGVPNAVVMKLAGIKKSTTLERYNKLSQEETADWAATLPFFAG